MAMVELADISDALSLVFRAKITSQINRNVVLLNLLPVVDGDGKVCTWTAKFSGRTNAAGYTEGADMADGDFDNEARVPATLNWATYRKGAKVSGVAAAAAASSVNPQSATADAGGDVFLSEIHDAVDRLALGIGADLYSGDGSAAHPLIGLASWADSAGAIASIDPAAYAEWAGNESSVALANLSLSELRKFHTSIYNACGEPPEFCIMPPAIFDAVGELFGSERRYVTELTTAAGAVKLTGGFKAIEVDGIPYVRDRHATANKIYGLNSRYLDVCALPAYNSPMTPDRFLDVMKRATGERPPMEAYEGLAARNNGLRAYVDFLAKTGDAQKAQVKSYCSLRVYRRNSIGKLNIT